MRRAAVLLASVITCVGCANRMFYYPDNRVYDTPALHRLPYEAVTFESLDGTKLTGWFVPAVGDAKATVIHLHGNAQNMTSHFSFVSWLPAEGFNVFVFDYRGYGGSGGKPEREGIYQDCVAALNYVAGRKDVDSDRLLVLGQSLGGANAIAMVGDGRASDVKAVAIDSAFYSYRLIARDKIRQIPMVSLLAWPLSFLIVSNDHSPAEIVDSISPTPLLIIHGTDDTIVPFRHGEMLFEAAAKPKSLIVVPRGLHTAALMRHGTRYRGRLVEFFESALAGSSSDAGGSNACR